ncbi:hypothetical protein ACHGLA_36095 [Streptomyces sp. YH02]|uniref:hypothetical protein n=1 Tax=Streptomyces sp. YH02 TaxID=3256999 RepID=UPI0037575532
MQPLPQLAAHAQAEGSRSLCGATRATATAASARAGRSGMLHLHEHRTVANVFGPLSIQTRRGVGPVQAGQLQNYGSPSAC